MERAYPGLAILNIDNLSVDYVSPANGGSVHALDRVSLGVNQGEVLGIVGESGCGKSTLAFSILRLLSSPPAKISGHINFDGSDLLSLNEKDLRKIRGNRISMVFQDSMSSLNPSQKIGDQIAEPLKIHQKATNSKAREYVLEVLRRVDMPMPEVVAESYPYELSGGMRQRASIATALITNPSIIVADEPTSSLDVTIQAQVIGLFSSLKKNFNTTLILITHELGVAAAICDRIAVMYAGKVAEIGSADDIFYRPLHPYTLGLMNATPRIGRQELRPIPGDVHSSTVDGSGCVFRRRCFLASDICSTSPPALREIGIDHLSACHYAERVQKV